MPIIAMRVREARDHPDADALRVYTFEADARELVIVANLETVYQVGDVAAVATPGTVLADGTRIGRRRLRGVDSSGMACGPSDAPVGADLSRQFGLELPAGDAEPIRWPSLEPLHAVIKAQEALATGVVRYRAKVKLHGTNAGIQLRADGRVLPQGRNHLLTRQQDNSGFGAWALDQRALLEPLIALAERPLVIFGEWCGPGIQKKVSVTQIDRRVLAVFAIQLGDHRLEAAELIVEPEAIRELLPEHPDLFVLPWEGEPLELDFRNRGQLRGQLDGINARVERVERCDPWVREVFGVEGTGEGLVFFPLADGPQDRDRCAGLMFKAKGEKHRVTRADKAVQLDPAVAESAEAFLALFLTEPRLEQAVAEGCGGELDPRRVPDFLRWVGQDVQKESATELEASGLTWKQVSRPLTQRARQWYLARAREI